jgi:hypothetical protein
MGSAQLSLGLLLEQLRNSDRFPDALLPTSLLYGIARAIVQPLRRHAPLLPIGLDALAEAPPALSGPVVVRHRAEQNY